ncbi:hypothetical protein COV20_00525 [Candidatus Woesearchaeota archaeon CG10_big_fil_rev_8_21_14_0_10_45_16]|nr:MAG: hypothetical protein COV20_00525 [Candidatus Woesearchaeota archaeon CG10_big_fil_rev_8_21_14_0_10_45_16]
MGEKVSRYKIIIASIDPFDTFSGKSVERPEYFTTLEEVKEYYLKQQRKIEGSRRKIWFYKVWEFGKEDYQDMGDDPLDFYKREESTTG